MHRQEAADPTHLAHAHPNVQVVGLNRSMKLAALSLVSTCSSGAGPATPEAPYLARPRRTREPMPASAPVVERR